MTSIRNKPRDQVAEGMASMDHAFPKLASKTRLRLDPATGKPTLLYPEGVLLLNPSAAAILELCDGARTMDDIVSVLATRFNSPETSIRPDVAQCLQELSGKGLVELPAGLEQPNREGSFEERSQTLGFGALSRPLGLLAELTYHCPLHCPYCSNPAKFPGASSELSTEDWKRVLREARALGVLHVLFSGGEPLQRPDLEELVGEAARLGLYSNLITSALGFSRMRAEKLKAAGLDSVQISFQAIEAGLADGIAGTKAHQHKLEAAKLARELGFPLTVNVVLHRANIGQLSQLVTLAESLGAHRLELANTQYYGWAFQNQAQLLPTREQVEKASQEAKEARIRLKGKMEILYVVPDYFANRPKPCMNGWGRRYLTVNPAGDVLPCPTAGEIKSLQFENVRQRSLDRIWEDSEAFNRFRGTEWMPDPCKSCDQREVDFGGCRCQAALLTGDPASTDPACDLSPFRENLTKLVADVRAKSGTPVVLSSYLFRVDP